MLLVTVHLTTWSRISGIIPPLLRGTVFNAVETSTNSSATHVWTRDVTDSIIAVEAGGKFTDRVTRFNAELHRLRQQLRHSPRENTNKTTCRTSAAVNRTVNDGLGTGLLRVAWSAKENYIDDLSGNPDIITFVLPWLGYHHNWSSLTDFSNVLYQRYYEWTADNLLCSWIETPGVIAARYDSCLLYTSPSPRDGLLSRMPSSA